MVGADAPALRQLGQMRRVTRVVAPHHQQDVGRLGQELQHGILALLGRRADRVEAAHVLGRSGRAVAALHGPADLIGDGERLAGEHGGLIGDAHPLEVAAEVEVR